MGLFSSKVKPSFPELATETVDDTVARLLREAQELDDPAAPTPGPAPQVAEAAPQPKVTSSRYRVVDGLSFDADGRAQLPLEAQNLLDSGARLVAVGGRLVVLERGDGRAPTVTSVTCPASEVEGVVGEHADRGFRLVGVVSRGDAGDDAYGLVFES
jgi:hypothetical protein